MTSKQCTVTVTQSIEFTKEAPYDLPVEEFDHWRDNYCGEGRPAQGYDDPYDPNLVKVFIQSHHDREEIEDALMAIGKEVGVDSDGFVTIEKVEVHG